MIVFIPFFFLWNIFSSKCHCYFLPITPVLNLTICQVLCCVLDTGVSNRDIVPLRELTVEPVWNFERISLATLLGNGGRVHTVLTTFLFLFKKNLFILFIYFWLYWVFVAVHGLSLVAASRGYSCLQRIGFSLQWFLLLQSTGSRHAGFSSCGLRALECRLSSCGAQA